MLFTQNIILDLLKDFHPESYIPDGKIFHLQQVQLLDKGHQPEDASVLYIGTSDQLHDLEADNLQDFCIVCVGTESTVSSYLSNHGFSLLLVPETYSLASVANALYTGFDSLQRWDAELNAAILQKSDFPTLFSIGGRYFGENAMIMVNSSYTVIGTNLLAAPSHERINFILQNGYFSKELTDGLAEMGYMANGFSYTTPSIIYPPTYMDCPLMVQSIHAKNNIFLGFITVYFIKDEPTAAQFEIFSHFSQKVRDYYLESSAENTNVPTPLEVFMADLIENPNNDDAFIRDRARSLRLPLDATYRLCVIQWDDFILPQAEYIKSRLRAHMNFSVFRVLLYHQSILILMPGEISSLKIMENMKDFLEEFVDLLKICDGYAGFSTASFTLKKLHIAYQQALTADRYGSLLNPDKRIYFYSHYYIYEMLDEYKQRYALEDMFIQKLRLLKNQSEEHYDNLSLLRNYLLTERSISATAKIMHMHRNSVIYRLGKIQEILVLDLDDPDVRLRLLVSFKILELIDGHEKSLPGISEPDSDAISFFE